VTRKQTDNRTRLFLGCVGLCFLAILLAPFLFVQNPPPLSSDEAKLVGEWINDKGTAVIYSRDRRLATSNGQFAGEWNIENGRLSATYWQPIELPDDFSISAIGRFIRRARWTDSILYEISFDDDGRSHRMMVPVHEHNPDGPVNWRRTPDR
jgi:hypothetical protein